MVKEGRKRKLIFKDVKITDAGQIKCTSNSDETEAELAVQCMFNDDDLTCCKIICSFNGLIPMQIIFLTDRNQFNKKLKDTNAVEREKVVLEIELQDQTAAAEWTLNGEPIKTSERCVV